MRVILLNNIRGVGQIGDIKDVRDGYARNFLLPRALAKPATLSNQAEAARLREKRAILLTKEEALIKQVAERLKDAVINITGRANENGTLFASIGKKELLAKIREQFEVELDGDMLIMPGHIKTIGEHKLTIRLAKDSVIAVMVVINAEKD